ncbi:hypothetical protein NLJ89_g3648 [Agrocybe chaxingu]|uniref:Uncharacterized protein n=1 Tax=Agrocybe chaxingu TaxID=84603 RepID=A0A9W8K235_9AGAR|nr:hypothetical protein NLJ89_g3648 [Agrocybe chaxingu]
MLMWALQQWYAARRVVDLVPGRGWTTVHSHFLQMGGFMLYKDGRPSQALCTKRLSKLVESGAVDAPNISCTEIQDRSKMNPFLVALVFLQAGWFLVQSGARVANRLPLTALEFETFMLLVLNVVLLVAWWDKPLDVAMPVRVDLKFEIPREELEEPSQQDPDFHREKAFHRRIKYALRAQGMLGSYPSTPSPPLLRLFTFLVVRPILVVSIAVVREIVNLFDDDDVLEGSLAVPVFYVSPLTDGGDSAVVFFIISAVFARHTLRQRTLASRRFASTESTAQQKAQDALAAAQKNAGKAFESAKKLLEPLGEKAGQLLGSYKQPLLYNLSVTKEIFKQIYVREGLQPPSLATVKETYSSIWAQVSHPTFVGNLIKSGDLGRVGIYGLQAYGIFKIGEIVGRRSLVGYKIHD